MKTNSFIAAAKKRIINDVKFQKSQVKQSVDFSEWYIKNLLPASKPVKQLKTMQRKEAEKYLFDRIYKKAEKEFLQIVEKYNNIQAAKDIESINISVEWKKSRAWGYNPIATAKVNYYGGSCDYFEGKASGCGYDKESTAIATALNSSYSVLKMLFAANKKDPDNKVYGYRSAKDGFFPHISGGVGVSCYPSVFGLFGFDFKNTGSGKSFGVYSVVKK